MDYRISNKIDRPHLIAGRIDRIRQEKGLTQLQLARALNISQPAQIPGRPPATRGRSVADCQTGGDKHGMDFNGKS